MTTDMRDAHETARARKRRPGEIVRDLIADLPPIPTSTLKPGDRVTVHYCDITRTLTVPRPDQENPMTAKDRHDELVALLTEIRDRLPEPEREEEPTCITEEPPVGSFVVDHGADNVWERREEGWFNHSTAENRTYPWAAVNAPDYRPLRPTTEADRERVGLPVDPTPADDLPGEPVEPSDLQAGDRVAFTFMGERITCTLASSPGGTRLRSDAPNSCGYRPNVVYRGGWDSSISDVRLIERAPREDENPDEALIDDALIERQGDLLRRIANELKGEPDAGSSHGWDDLPRLAAEATSMIEAHRVGIATQKARAEKAETERDEWREVAARYEDGRDKWQAKWRESDEARERAETDLADERDRHDATITERDALRERLDALRVDLSPGGLIWTVDSALRRDDERAKGGQR